MFKASSKDNVIINKENTFEVDRWCEVETPNGFVYASTIKLGDMLLIMEDGEQKELKVTNITNMDNKITYSYKEGR